MLEIERKFLVNQKAALSLTKFDTSNLIEQGYLVMDHRGHVRIRDHETKGYTITAKSLARELPHTALVREEIEFAIDASKGKALFAMCQHVIAKTRYNIGPWEFDVFYDSLKGLCLLEIELPTADSALPAFPEELAEFVIREVTHDVRYQNDILAQSGIPA